MFDKKHSLHSRNTNCKTEGRIYYIDVRSLLNRNRRILILLILILNVSFSATGQSVYTSVSDGAWESPSTWICTSGDCESNSGSGAGKLDGFPGRNDNVIIDHTVTVNNVADNGSAGVKPNTVSGICSPSASDGCTNNAFRQVGTITVNSGGAFNSSVWVTTLGKVTLNDGTFTVLDGGNNTDLFVLGRFDLLGASTLRVSETLLLGGTALLNVSENAITEIRDDVILDGDDAFLCGRGTLRIDDDNNPSEDSNAIELVNYGAGGNNVLDQICDELTITCTDDSVCCVENCADDLDDLNDSGTVNDGEAPTQETLPVEYTYFKGQYRNNEVYLIWETATEIDNDRFEIQKSTNGISFNKIGAVKGHGDSNELIQYSFTDTSNIPGIIYYRLKQIDYDGDFEYSDIITFYSELESTFDIFPNPISDRMNLVLGDRLDRTEVQVTVRDLSGRIYHQEIIYFDHLINSIPVTWKAGIYLLEVRNSSFSGNKKIITK